MKFEYNEDLEKEERIKQVMYEIKDHYVDIDRYSSYMSALLSSPVDDKPTNSEKFERYYYLLRYLKPNNVCYLHVFNDLYDVVVHVHTHPELGDEYASDCYSNQDLYTYGYLQKHHQYGTYYTLFIGAMLNNHNGKENISFVYYDEEDKTFYKIPNIYYVKTEKNKEYIKK